MVTLADIEAEEESRGATVPAADDALGRLEAEEARREAEPPEVGLVEGALTSRMSPLGQLIGQGEAALTIGAGIAGEIIGGYVGIGASLWPGEPGQGSRAVEWVREHARYMPRSETGLDILEGVGAVLGPVGEGIHAVETGLGSSTLNATGNAALATAAHTAPTALLSVLGLGVIKKVASAGRAARAAARQIKAEGEIRRLLRDPTLGAKYAKMTDPGAVQTGRPITMHTVRNTEKAPDMGPRFGQDVEPAGQYVNMRFDEALPAAGWEAGIVELQNPLIIDAIDTVAWKRALSEANEGAVGAALTQRLQAQGYDGIITKQGGQISETVIFDPKKSNLTKGFVEAEERSMIEIAEDLRAGQAERTALGVQPVEKVLAAGEEAGIALSPEHYSNNPSFIKVVQALKKQPESKLKKKDVATIEAVSARADELVAKMGGQPDRSILNVRVRDEFDLNLKDLTTQADKAYAAVESALVKGTVRMEAPSVKAYLLERLRVVGGDVSGLSKIETELHKILFGPETQGGRLRPTYGRLDVVRAKMEKARRNGDESATDDVYAAIIRDQQAVAEGVSPALGAQYAMGRKLTDQINVLEDQMVTLFGRQMNQSLMPRIASASAELATKGEATQFTQLMEALPKGKRRQAAAMILNDMFFPVSGDRIITPQFAAAWRNLNQNKWAKAELFKHLPKEARTRFDSLGTIAESIEAGRKMAALEGGETAVIRQLESGTPFLRMFKAGFQTFAFSKTGYIGSRGAGAITDIASGQFKVAKRTDELLASDEFNAAVRNAAAGRLEVAERLLQKSKKWEAWKQVIDRSTAAEIGAMGAIPWLLKQEDEEPISIEQPSEQGGPTIEDLRATTGQPAPQLPWVSASYTPGGPPGGPWEEL